MVQFYEFILFLSDSNLLPPSNNLLTNHLIWNTCSNLSTINMQSRATARRPALPFLSSVQNKIQNIATGTSTRSASIRWSGLFYCFMPANPTDELSQLLIKASISTQLSWFSGCPESQIGKSWIEVGSVYCCSLNHNLRLGSVRGGGQQSIIDKCIE